MDIDEAYAEIQVEIDNPRQYSHNIVSSILRMMDTQYGKARTNQLVVDLDLPGEFSINPVSEDE